MELNVIAYLLLLAAVAALRMVELRLSRNHQREMLAQGAHTVPDPNFRWMVAVHTFVLAGSALEVVFLRRPFIPILALICFILFLVSNFVRWWVIRTLGEHWNVQVVDSTKLGVITTGPFRFVRHPNYAAVFVEMLTLPLMHTAWLTATIGTIAHIGVLQKRLSVEDPVLLADPAYRAAMGSKPRFVPGLF